MLLQSDLQDWSKQDTSLGTDCDATVEHSRYLLRLTDVRKAEDLQITHSRTLHAQSIKQMHLSKGSRESALVRVNLLNPQLYSLISIPYVYIVTCRYKVLSAVPHNEETLIVLHRLATQDIRVSQYRA